MLLREDVHAQSHKYGVVACVNPISIQIHHALSLITPLLTIWTNQARRP